jgi:hypothetical protein
VIDPWSERELGAASGAILSPCEHYRYRLWRETGWIAGDGCVTFVMLNPSTADSTTDDPTIRKCRGFASRMGMARFRVVNLFAWRATDPRQLAELAMTVAVGQENGDHLRAALSGHSWGGRHEVVLAWGSTGGAKVAKMVRERLVVVRKLIRLYAPNARCLGTAQDGSPRHPLMLSYDTPLTSWEAA